jgi:hypothetical protein
MVQLGEEALNSIKGNFYKIHYPEYRHPTYYEAMGPSLVLNGVNGEIKSDLWVHFYIYQCVGFGKDWFHIKKSFPFDEISKLEKVQKTDLPWLKQKRDIGQPIEFLI